MEKNLIQCYKVEQGRMYISSLTKTEMEKARYFQSPIDAITDNIKIHSYWLANEKFRVKNREEVINNLKDFLEKYKSGEDVFNNIENNSIDIYSDTMKKIR